MTGVLQIPDNLKKLDSHVLKMIAVATMLIDHIGASLYYPLNDRFDLIDAPLRDQIYQTMRDLGRVAFPVFAFFLVEGFILTKSRLKYGIRLLIFALLSEYPFQMAFYAEFSPGMRNVIFTLLLGLVTIDCLEHIGVKREPTAVMVLLSSVVISLPMFIAWAVDSDYDYRGVFLIVIFYLFREMRPLALILGYLSFLWEPWSVLGFLLLLLYNGERGRQHKYFFYAFYPVHLMILYIFRYRLLGF